MIDDYDIGYKLGYYEYIREYYNIHEDGPKIRKLKAQKATRQSAFDAPISDYMLGYIIGYNQAYATIRYTPRGVIHSKNSEPITLEKFNRIFEKYNITEMPRDEMDEIIKRELL